MTMSKNASTLAKVSIGRQLIDLPSPLLVLRCGVPVRPALKHRAMPTKPPEGGWLLSRFTGFVCIAGWL